MKKLLIILCTLTLCIIPFSTIVVSAEEPTETEVVTVTETEEATLKEQIANALAKLNELKSEDFFKDKVLPFLINGAIDIALVAFLILRPYLKNKSLIKQLTGYVEALESERDNLNKLLNSSNPEEIKNAVEKLFGGKFDEIITQFESKYAKYLQEVVSMKTTNELTYAQLVKITKAMQIAYASKPEAATLLAESPTKNVLDELMAENDALKETIRELKGQEADKLIGDSKEI